MKFTPREHAALTQDGIDVYEEYRDRYGSRHPAIFCEVVMWLTAPYVDFERREYEGLKRMIDMIETVKRKRNERQNDRSRVSADDTRKEAIEF